MVGINQAYELSRVIPLKYARLLLFSSYNRFILLYLLDRHKNQNSSNKAYIWSLPTRAGDFHPRMKRHARRTRD
jgi:hypothetical protein